jgi:hypothetical protein
VQVRNILTFMSSLEVKAANPRRSAKQNPAVRYLLSWHESRNDNKDSTCPQFVPARGFHHLKEYTARLCDELRSLSYLFSFNEDRNSDYN